MAVRPSWRPVGCCRARPTERGAWPAVVLGQYSQRSLGPATYGKDVRCRVQVQNLQHSLLQQHAQSSHWSLSATHHRTSPYPPMKTGETGPLALFYRYMFQVPAAANATAAAHCAHCRRLRYPNTYPSTQHTTKVASPQVVLRQSLDSKRSARTAQLPPPASLGVSQATHNLYRAPVRPCPSAPPTRPVPRAC